jgi:uncharacterized protein YbjT (DUF2867 family)
MILVTGASGNVGSAVLQELLRAGAPVRGLYRSNEDAAKTPSGANPVIADFADRASLGRALDGVDSVFLVCSPIPQLVELESNVVDACRERGVKHLVQNSALGASVYDKSFPRWHYAVEERVRASGIPATILRPESFMQNIVTYFAGTIESDGAFYAAGGNAPIGFVDVRDVGAVAAKVLTSDGHTGKTYTVTGPEVLTYPQVAAKLSALLCREVKYVALTQEQLRQSMQGMGMPPWQVEALADLQAYYTDGPGAKVTGDVRAVLGREPIRFDQFLKDYAASFAPAAANA